MFELTCRLAKDHQVTVYELCLGEDSSLGWPKGIDAHQIVVKEPRWAKRNRRLSEVVLQPLWLRAERAVAARVNESDAEVLIVHPSRVTQSPSVLYLSDIPTVSYMQEIRRCTYESGYRPEARSIPPWLGRVLDRLADLVPQRIDRRGVAAADLLVCNSAFTAEAILRTYGRSARISYLGVDEVLFAPRRASDPRPPPYVLLVGGLEQLKEPGLVIRALGTIDHRRRPELVVVGERKESKHVDDIRALAVALDVTMHIRAAVDDATLASLYQGASATCCASRLEPFGLTAVESLACGTPVVAVNEGGFRETVIDGVNGRLVPRDAEAMGQAIDEVVHAEFSRSQLRATVIPRFTWDRASAGLMEAVREAAGHPS
jgi:glycosyltransferase involved in cell wall biosynthesis